MNYTLQILYTNRLCNAVCPQMKNLALEGRGLGHVTYFKFLVILCIISERLQIEISSLVQILITTCYSHHVTNYP